jgi:hypothetical protein
MVEHTTNNHQLWFFTIYPTQVQIPDMLGSQNKEHINERKIQKKIVKNPRHSLQRNSVKGSDR